ncbi:MAG: carboxypeptidase regulatory-like domain-containing protein [Acidobacteria bacterium]|nr:carboxypeptidase regulatory-like domain-containing protein [Acidobacteriota bacterium]
MRKSLRKNGTLFLLLLVGLFSASRIPAQDTANLSGTVTDPTGAVIANAKVTARDNATGQEFSTTSNQSGNFIFTNARPSSYTVTVDSAGFVSTTIRNVVVDPNIGRHLDVALKIGSSTDTVTVEAGANALQVESAAVGQLITQEQVKSIQLNGRNPVYLAQMEPGVVRNAPMAGLGFAMDQPLYINGARNQDTIQTFDGAPMVRTRSNGTSVGTVDVDSTSQVQVLTSSYPAEYGRSNSGQVRMIPKSGTNQFHGSAYEYFRNTILNSNSWSRKLPANPANIRSKAPGMHYNQFGYNVNGPIKRDRLFVMFGQEWVKYNHDDTVQRKVPTALMRTGNFSELLTPNIFTTAGQIVSPYTGNPYPNNVIDPADISAQGLALLNAYPLPNTSTGSYNWIDSALYSERQRKDSLVIDWRITDRNAVRFSMLNYNYDDYEPHYGNFNRNPRIFHRPNQIGVFHYIWTKSPTFVNDVFVSAAGEHVRINIDTSKGLYDRTTYGINYPYLYSAGTKLLPNKIPTISITGFDTLDGGPYPSHSGGMVYDAGDTITKVVHNHTFKFGVQFEYAGENNFDQISVSTTVPGATNNQNGRFVFTDGRNGYKVGGIPQNTRKAVSNVATGLFDTYGEIGQRSYTLYRGQMYEGFAQDTWRATPKLVIEAGVRYSIMTPYYAKWGNQSVFNPANYNPANAVTVDPNTDIVTGGDRYNGVVIPGSGFPSSAQGHVDPAILSSFNGLFRGYSKFYSPIVKSNIQPRFGLTYQVYPTTVLRIGGGRYFQRLGITDNVFTGGNAPFQPSSTVTNGNVNTPGGVGTNDFPFNYSSQAYNYPSPEAYQWNAAVEQQFNSFATLTLAYVGRRGIHLEQLGNINQLLPGTLLGANASIKPDALRPYKGFSNITEAENRGSSIYHSLQANLRRRMSHGLLFGLAYTWSKSLDFGSANNYVLPNYFDKNISYGLSDFDVRHVFVANYVWNIGFWDHSSALLKHTIGGWQLSGTVQTQTGRPLNVSTGTDYAGVGPGSGTQYFPHLRPTQTFKGFAGQTGTAKWFDTTVYPTHAQMQAAPFAGTFAPRGSRNAITGVGFQSVNAALMKTMHIIPGHENHTLAFRAEAFNLLNHPTPDNPNTTPTSGDFGLSKTKGGTYGAERVYQFSLRYAF